MKIESMDSREFRQALGAFATGVTIVTTRDQAGGDVGLTANSFSSVSLDPPMILWSLARTSLSLSAFQAAEYFAVHILSSEQDQLSATFATRGADKFSGLAVDRGHGGIPLFCNCSARFQCRTAFQYDGGDHVIFVGEVLNFDHSRRPSLAFHGGKYGLVIKKPGDDLGKLPEAEFRLDDLGTLLARAYHQLRLPLRHAQRRIGLSDVELVVLRQLALGRHDTIATHDRMIALIGQRVTIDDIAGLAARGLVEVAPPITIDSVPRLTENGRKTIVELAAVAKAAEADAIEELDSSEGQLLNMLLLRLIRRTRPPNGAAEDNQVNSPRPQQS